MLCSVKNRKLRRRDFQRGASLIEVLVALVLLVVGIYSIARLFPGGFISLRSAENDTFADRLAQGQIEQLKENNNFLLDAVYMYSNQVGFFTDNSNVLPNALDTYTPPGGTTPDVSLADVNKARYISGESFTVPAPNTVVNSTTNGTSVHILNDGPVVLNSTGTLAEPPPLPATPSPTVKSPIAVFGLPPVHSGPWVATVGNAPPANFDASAGVPGSSDLPSDLIAAGQPQYAIDYTNQEIALAPEPYDQHFTLELKLAFPASGSGASATSAETVTYYVPLLLPKYVPATGAGYQGNWFDPTTNNAATNELDPNRPVVTDINPPSGVNPTGWVTGSAELTRTLTPVATVAALKSNYTAATTDPYTYVVYSSDSTLEAVNLGVLAVNPRIQGQTVSVSYLVYNWHIIREDETVPTTTTDTGQVIDSTQSPIHLTLDHLKRVGDVLDNQTTYPGLFRNIGAVSTDDATVGYDIIVLDTDTGQSIGLTAPPIGTTGASVFDLDNSNGSNLAPGQFAVSYQNGYITLPDGVGTTSPSTSAWTAIVHQHVRVFYEGDYDWAVALQKGPSLYTRNDSGLMPLTGAPLPKYSLLAGQYAIDANGNIYFPRSDAGQSVELMDISYQDTTGKQYQIGTLTLSIADSANSTYADDTLDNPSSGVRMGGDTQENLLNSLTVDSNSTLQINSIKIGAVQGISARSLVVWKERNLWKSREVTTILNQ
jgi:hypothetical protein